MYSLLKNMRQEPAWSDNETTFRITLSKTLRRRLIAMHAASFDHERGGLRMPVKFLDLDSVEYSLFRASLGDDAEAHMARLTLIRSLALIDPRDGGVRSYSTNGWGQPGARKPMSAQAGHLRLYALGYAFWRYDVLRRAVWRIRGYLHTRCFRDNVFVEPAETHRLTGARRAHDGSVRARENGWAIEALASCYEFTGDRLAMSMSLQAAGWVVANLCTADGGFRATADAGEATELGDSLGMGRALLQLHRTTSDTHWLTQAVDTAHFIGRGFRLAAGGYAARQCAKPPLPQIDENIALARFANLLAFYTKDRRHLELAEHAMRYLVRPEIATARIEEAGILLADYEFRHRPRSVVISGDAGDPRANTSFTAALRRYGWYKCIRWPAREKCAGIRKPSSHCNHENNIGRKSRGSAYR